LNPIRKRRTPRRPAFRPRVELLEDRCVPTIFVTNTLDSGAGSLRQAILDANATPGGPVQIDFNILATDLGHPSDPSDGHVYYRDDGVSNQLTMTNVAQTTASSDLANTDRDPDYEASWWSIHLKSVLPEIMRPVVIDGFSQQGAHPAQGGGLPVMRIE